jgi:DNA-binding MarR family transcriptional regulator
MGSGAITVLIDRLEARGFVKRIPHPSDRRSLLVHYLQQEAKTIARPLALQEHLAQRIDALSDEQKAVVLSFLEGVAKDVMKVAQEP